MNGLSRLDAVLTRHVTFWILAAALLGVVFYQELHFLTLCSPFLFAFMTFANGLSGGFPDLFQAVRRPLPVLVVVTSLHVVMPLLALGVGSLLFPHDPLFTTGLILDFAVPTGVLSLMWVGIARGNAPLCLSIVLLDTLSAPIVVPWTMKLLAGSVVEMDTLGMLKDLSLMIALPALAAMCFFQFRGREAAARLRTRCSPFAKLCMLVIAMANATGCGPFLRNLTPQLVLVIASVLGLILFGFFLGYCMGRIFRQDFPSIQTMTLNSGLRNINSGAVLAMAYFPPDVLFPVALTPLFLQPLASLMVKCLDRLRPRDAAEQPLS